MKIRSFCLVAFVLASLTPCFAHHTAVVVNKENAVENVTSAHLAKVIRGEIRNGPTARAFCWCSTKSPPVKPKPSSG